MYSERASWLPEVVAWQRTVRPDGPAVRILPDGCLDLIWHDGHLFVAGPDTTAQVSAAVGGGRLAALRFGAGTGPGAVGVPADELRDRQVPLADLWHPAEVRRLSEQVATGGPAALERAVARRWRAPDPIMAGVAARARAGSPVGAIADDCGLSPRHLHRRCRTAFGYGPKMLVRILRLQRAVALARSGTAFAAVAATSGYADQAHLARDVRALAGVPLGALIGGAGAPMQEGQVVGSGA
jgi:AraC-like DNA-binding protein